VQDRVAVAFFGDGATNHGYLHETLNFAKVHSLPVVFVCENNLYGEFTPLASVTAGADIAARVAPYGIPAEKVDGNDVVAVRAAAIAAVERARATAEPSFLECLTYRHFGHSKSDPGAYRTKEEVASWKERDPLTVAAERLGAEGVEASRVEAAAEEASQRVEAALAAAEESPFPEPAKDAATEFAA